jgi:tRNA pseudouridine55 synthase
VEVVVHSLDLLAWEPPDARLRVECAAGTYIRAIARDLGRACASAAHCSALRRTRAGQFGLEDVITLDEMCEGEIATVAEHLVPMRQLLPHWPAVQVSERGVTAVRHGRLVPASEIVGEPGTLDAEWVRVLAPDGELLALGTGARRFARPEDLHASVVLA